MNCSDELAAKAREMLVRPPAGHRLCRATASQFVLNSGDERIPVGV